MTKVLLACALFTALAAPARAANPAEKPVLAALDVWKQAVIKKDKAAFEKVLHPDLVYGHSDGHLEDKATAIDKIVNGPAVWEAIDLSDTKVHVRGDTAFVTGKADYRERENGKVTVVHLAVLSVWVKGPAGWQMIARQATRPTPPTPVAVKK